MNDRIGGTIVWKAFGVNAGVSFCSRSERCVTCFCHRAATTYLWDDLPVICFYTCLIPAVVSASGLRLLPPVSLSFQTEDWPGFVSIFDAGVVVAGFRCTFPCLTDNDEFFSIPCWCCERVSSTIIFNSTSVPTSSDVEVVGILSCGRRRTVDFRILVSLRAGAWHLGFFGILLELMIGFVAAPCLIFVVCREDRPNVLMGAVTVSRHSLYWMNASLKKLQIKRSDRLFLLSHDIFCCIECNVTSVKSSNQCGYDANCLVWKHIC